MPSLTITYPAGDGARFAAALGKMQGLKDTQDPPQDRPATAAECKQFLISQAQAVIRNAELPDLQAAALATVTHTPADMT